MFEIGIGIVLAILLVIGLVAAIHLSWKDNRDRITRIEEEFHAAVRDQFTEFKVALKYMEKDTTERLEGVLREAVKMNDAVRHQAYNLTKQVCGKTEHAYKHEGVSSVHNLDASPPVVTPTQYHFKCTVCGDWYEQTPEQLTKAQAMLVLCGGESMSETLLITLGFNDEEIRVYKTLHLVR